jgi:hypothetical protein
MKLTATSRFLLFLSLSLCALTHTGHSATTIFHYRVNDTDGAGLPNIPSVGGDDGTADDGLEFNSDIPTNGVPAGAGNRSIDGAAVTGINSANIDELDNALIAAEGGFTYETWFNWSGFGDINSIIDYAGTEKLVIDVNAGSGMELRMRINSDSALDSFIAEVEPETWYYTAVVFDTQGNELAGDDSITGIFNLYLDGELLDTTDELTISNFGDTLDRTIGVSKHPQGFPRDYFEGLIYEPRVSLGALGADELLFGGGDELVGDFNGNGLLDAEDINDLTTQSASGANLAAYDLNADTFVNEADVKVWISDLFKSWVGDADLSGEFNSGDLVTVLASGKYESDSPSVWSEGDFNGDGRTNTNDLVAALSDGGYEAGARQATAAVPEPTSGCLLLLGILSILRRRRPAAS